ncbi:hypothetical protein Moror_10163 [Moniliophthora roreri MCA 2997]|uniref:Uncharacterized protein n=1 Tax=Moniliophthora roreri (strain MCA 2997) TaxID=1381753 RepID=V2WS45_MONRO|nr:hypothetical protein Moror_10163 [Moniliophthora roreri MCA 2997]
METIIVWDSSDEENGENNILNGQNKKIKMISPGKKSSSPSDSKEEVKRILLPSGLIDADDKPSSCSESGMEPSDNSDGSDCCSVTANLDDIDAVSEAGSYNSEDSEEDIERAKAKKVFHNIHIFPPTTAPTYTMYEVFF